MQSGIGHLPIQSDDLRQECWISYEVIRDSGHAISPSKKQFCNRCQETFRMKMQASRPGNNGGSC